VTMTGDHISPTSHTGHATPPRIGRTQAHHQDRLTLRGIEAGPGGVSRSRGGSPHAVGRGEGGRVAARERRAERQRKQHGICYPHGSSTHSGPVPPPSGGWRRHEVPHVVGPAWERAFRNRAAPSRPDDSCGSWTQRSCSDPTNQQPGSDGAVVCLTNDASYWPPVTHGRQTRRLLHLRGQPAARRPGLGPDHRCRD